MSECCYLETEAAGYINVKSVQVPDGITYHYEKSEVDGYCLNFSGQPTKAGIYPYQIQYEDELGCQYTYKTTWIIGDNNTLVASMGILIFYIQKEMYIRHQTRLKLREEAEVIHLKLQITRIRVHTLMRIIIQMILMRLLELDFAIVRQGIKPCM